MRKVIVFALFVLIAMAIPAAAQTDPRLKVSEALAKGDTAGAEKLLQELSKSAASIVVFEELRACGFYPQETRLACVIDIKQPFGYGGPIGSIGSFEYVSFFVDFQSDGFQTSDYVGSGIVHMTDGSMLATGRPTQFAVYRDFNPRGGPRTSNGGASTTTTTNGPLLNVLAKLSWFAPVTNPAQVQLWGNDVFFIIRMMPVR